MAIFKRVMDILRANINDLLERAEDPEKMLKLIVQDMEEALQKATVATAQAVANARRLKAQYEKYKELSEEWQRKAEDALKQGDEDLARKCLAKKVEYDGLAKTYMNSYMEAEATAEKLKEQLEQLKVKLSEARSRYATLIAKSKSAEAQKQFAKMAGGFGKDVFSKFDKMEEKILRKEEEAKAMLELSEDDVEKEFEKLQKEKAVDSELEKLKEKLSKGG